jgi:hypothetical protein
MAARRLREPQKKRPKSCYPLRPPARKGGNKEEKARGSLIRKEAAFSLLLKI